MSVTTRFKRALRRNHQRKRLLTKPAVATEIREVGGDDLRLGMELGQHDERGVGGIHALILEHEFLGARAPIQEERGKMKEVVRLSSRQVAGTTELRNGYEVGAEL